MGDSKCCPAPDSLDLICFCQYEGSIQGRHTLLEALQEFDMLFVVCIYVWCVNFYGSRPVSYLLWLIGGHILDMLFQFGS